ncbi:MAG: amidohydrolase family protein, partial [Bacteroidales bacterium]|nr:amidohydrolase family protein [Bacteroidales bacterium]
MEYWLTGGTVVNEGRRVQASVWVKDGRIAGIFENGEEAARVTAKAERVDVSGCWILPGVIDDQVHFREPGLTYKGDIRSESRAAVAGGVTSYMEMPNTKPPTLTQALLQEKYDRAAEGSLANYSFYMGCSEDNLDEVLKTDPARVCGIKIFL